MKTNKGEKHFFLLANHVNLLVAQEYVEKYSLENVYAVLRRGYLPPKLENITVIESIEMMNELYADSNSKIAYIHHSPTQRVFGNFSASEFDGFYFLEEGTLSYTKKRAWSWGNNKKLRGGISIYDDSFPGMPDERIVLGEKTYERFKYDGIQCAEMLVLEESKWFSEWRRYFEDLERFAIEYRKRSSKTKLMVATKRTDDCLPWLIGKSFDILKRNEVDFEELPTTIVKESLIFQKRVMVNYYVSSLGYYAERMGYPTHCIRSMGKRQ